MVYQALHGAKREIPKQISRIHTSTFVVHQREKYYTVNLGDAQKFPTCECLDFHQYYLPCKHFFIVFEQVPCYSWESLPTYFRNSPLISIDESISSNIQHSDLKVYEEMKPQVILNKDENEEENDFNSSCKSTHNVQEDGRKDGEKDVQEDGNNHEESDSQFGGKCSRGIEVLTGSMRSDLHVLQDFTYLSKDHSALTIVASMIKETVNLAKSLLPEGCGLILRPTPEKRNIRGLLQNITTLCPLPSRKCRKRLSLFDRYKKRVGRGADKVKKGAFISLDEVNAPQPKWQCIEQKPSYGKKLVMLLKQDSKQQIKKTNGKKQSQLQIVKHKCNYKY